MSSNNTAHYRGLEFAAAFLLVLGGAASAWNSYQATRWSGVQAASYSRANALRIESTGKSTEEGLQKSIDVGTFEAWLNAYASGDTELEQFYRERFRPEFRPAFEKWAASRPLMNPQAPLTPFEMSEYQLDAGRRARELEEQAVQAFQEGQAANEKGDAYVLNSVTISFMLLFAGISQQFRSRNISAALIAIATAFFVLGLYRIVTYPVI